MRSETRSYRTGGQDTVLDITDDCAEFVRGQGDGLLHVFVPHATAGIAIIETGSGSDDDLLAALGDLLPADDRWRHQHGTPGHGRSHVMPALVPPYATVWRPVPRTDDEVPRPSREELILAGIDVLRARPAPARCAPSPWRDLGVALSVLVTVGSAVVGGMFVLAWVCR